MTGLNSSPRSSRRWSEAKLFHHRSERSAGIKFDQDLVFGHVRPTTGVCACRSARFGGANGGEAYAGPRHFDYKPRAPRRDRRLGLGQGETMCQLLLLKNAPASFRADPEVKEALAAAKVDELRAPTLADGESYDQVGWQTARPGQTRCAGVLRRKGVRIRPAPATRNRASFRRALGARVLRTGTAR